MARIHLGNVTGSTSNKRSSGHVSCDLKTRNLGVPEGQESHFVPLGNIRGIVLTKVPGEGGQIFTVIQTSGSESNYVGITTTYT